MERFVSAALLFSRLSSVTYGGCRFRPVADKAMGSTGKVAAKLLPLAQQLPLRDALRVGCAEFARRLLDRHKTFSYAQNGEDLIIDVLLGRKSVGRYVDVGCNHPVRLSNTYRLYLRGWTGLAIDANSTFEKEFVRRRPNDI